MEPKKSPFDCYYRFPSLESFMERYNISLLEHAEPFEIEIYDKEWAKFYTKVASKTVIDAGKPRTLEEKRANNFYGLIGEKAMKEKLRERRIITLYNEREPRFFEKLHPEPFDFAIATKDGSYITLEIKTISEGLKFKNLIKGEPEDKKWEISDYTIGIKMLKFEKAIEAEILGYGYFAGYLTKQEMETLRIRDDEYPCFGYRCRAIKLSELPHGIGGLWQTLDSQAIKWKP